jgi:hypothetical protein
MRERLNWGRGIALAIALGYGLDCAGAAALQASPGLPHLNTVSGSERQMIESACRLDRQKGPAASRCVRQELEALQASPGSPDLSAVSDAERQMIESACRQDRQIGPAAYYRCARQQHQWIDETFSSQEQRATLTGVNRPSSVFDPYAVSGCDPGGQPGGNTRGLPVARS